MRRSPGMEPSYEDHTRATLGILRDSQKGISKPYGVVLAEKRFVVFPNVFSPKYFRDTEIFSRGLPVVAGETMLELGSGTGIISVMAVYRGMSKVVAVDVNPKAVENTKENVRLHNM